MRVLLALLAVGALLALAAPASATTDGIPVTCVLKRDWNLVEAVAITTQHPPYPVWFAVDPPYECYY